MERNKDIADIQAAEATYQKKKKYILCYHSFSVNNFKKASVQIRKLAGRLRNHAPRCTPPRGPFAEAQHSR